MVARATLIGLLQPRDLVKMSLIPPSSNAARTGPRNHARTFTAGRRNTFAPQIAGNLMGNAGSHNRHLNQVFLPSSTAFRMAPDTSRPFPDRRYMLAPSPTTTKALNSAGRPSPSWRRDYADNLLFQFQLIRVDFMGQTRFPPSAPSQSLSPPERAPSARAATRHDRCCRPGQKPLVQFLWSKRWRPIRPQPSLCLCR